jgi:tetratricopeptide (TPR) repeat protein
VEQQRQLDAGGPSARIPSATPGCDLRVLPITPTEAFVFSRVDGSLSEAELRICVGLDGEVVTAALDRLAALGAIRFEGGEPKRSPSQIFPRVRPEPAARPSPASTLPPRRSDVSPPRSDVAPKPRTAAPDASADHLADLVHLGDTAARGRLWEQAAAAYEEAADLAPANPSVLYKVAGALFRCDQYAAAARFAQRAASLAPDRFDTWLLLAHIHHAAEAPVLAREALAQAAQLAPGDERVARLDRKLPR